MFQGGRARMLKFLIINLGRDRIILSYPWLREFNPEIDWPTKFIKGPPFLAVDATIEPNSLITHAKQFTHRRYLNPNEQALIRHMDGEYKEENPPQGQKEDHTFVTIFDQRKHRSAPLPLGALERIKNELNQVEKYLDLTKTAQSTDQSLEEDFAETMKEQQARYVMQTQFTPDMPSETKIKTQEQQFEHLIKLFPLATIAQLKEENHQ
jgi:hypothetical protein